MSAKPGDMRFFADHNLPESVCKMLESFGYETIRLRRKTASDAPDMLVAAVAEANEAILVTMDSDFKSIAARTGIGQRRFRKLSLLRRSSHVILATMIRIRYGHTARRSR